MPENSLQPGMMNHVALPTADPDRGTRFYVEVLGFVATPRPAFSFGGAWLMRSASGVMIHLIHDETGRDVRGVGPINTRGPHIALQVDDYDAAVAGLQRHNVPFVERTLPDYGYRQVFFQDPDGNVIELGEWPSPSAMFPEFAATPHSPAEP
jgi:catechol 2,3-dioxygenase-like lactoylglutathione lyase family enzyme